MRRHAPSFEHHVSVNIQDATVRSRGGMGAGAAAAGPAGLSMGPAPLESLLQEAGAGKHAEVLRYLKKSLDDEKREFSRLQQDVFDSLTEHEVMEASFDRQFEAQQTFGGQAADYVAAVGGSWRFLFFFAVFIVTWMLVNTAFHVIAWDPYPFILLNLFLSCLASFQAPVIMMAQNRSVERDRGQSDYTARVNLRAELVTRHINAKLDAFISTAWRRLYESQAIQTSMVERLLDLERQQVALVRALGRAQARARAGSREDMGMETHAAGGDGGGAGTPGGVPSASLAYRNFGRRMSDEVLESPALQELVPGTVLSVYEEEEEEEGEEGKEEEVEPQRGDEKTGETAAGVPTTAGVAATAAAAAEGPTSPPKLKGPSSSLVVQPSSSPSPAAAPAQPTAISIYATPLAALCVAPPAARGLRALDLPWLLETEEDPHTIFLMRTMLRAFVSGCGGGHGEGGGSGLWEDAERMIFEHRSSSADNFFGSVSTVHIQSRDPSLATKGVVCTLLAARSHSGQCRSGSGDCFAVTSTRGRRVAPAFVTRVVEAASLVDTGGGAEPWFPFDVAYDLSFPGEGAALDSLLAGDAILTLRNALDLPFQTSMGEIRQMTLHPKGCPCSRICAEGGSGDGGAGGGSNGTAAAPTNAPGLGLPGLSRAMSSCAGAIYVRQGEIPPRFKPSLSQDRDDRISDFWKMPLSRVQISYSPAPIFACVTLRPGQAVVPLTVEFLSHPRSQQQQHPQQHPQHPNLAGGGGGGGEFSTPPLSRQGSGSGYGILALSPLTRAGTKGPSELMEPAPQAPASRSSTPTGASAAAMGGAAGSGACGGNSLNRAQAGSLKKVIELWHGRHHHHGGGAGGERSSTHHHHGGGAGGERSSIPDSATGTHTGNPAEGIEALLSASQHHLRDVSEGGTEGAAGGKELLAIINPSAEALCEALAHGGKWTARRRARGRRSRAGSRDDGKDEEEPKDQQGAEGEGDAEEDGPLHLDALSPEALDDLPHNRWLALPLHKASATAPPAAARAGAGRVPTTYEIDMPLIPGPAVVFFYSPYGRLRLRGVLRDDGAEPIMEGLE